MKASRYDVFSEEKKKKKKERKKKNGCSILCIKIIKNLSLSTDLELD